MTASDSTELLARLAPVSDSEAAEVFGAGKERLLGAITASRTLVRGPRGAYLAARS